MLRMGFMSGDFHPMLLVLAEREEFAPLIDVLRTFSETGEAIDLHENDRIYAHDVAVRLVALDTEAGMRPGLYPQNGIHPELCWALKPAQAGAFAERIADLVSSQKLSGSLTLACGELHEVKVVISYGEWEDDFLAGTKA